MSVIRQRGELTWFERLCQGCQLTWRIVASLTLLLASLPLYIVAIATPSWTVVGSKVKIGIWIYCHKTLHLDWDCHKTDSDFLIAVQTFVILTLISYACATIVPTLHFRFQSKLALKLTSIAICILTFCIVSLQMMTIVCFSIKACQYARGIDSRVTLVLRNENNCLTSWSFILLIISTIMTTLAGILTVLEMKTLLIGQRTTTEDSTT